VQDSLNDEFDTVSGVGGKHLAPKRALDYIISFLSLTLISALIASGGLLGLRLWDSSLIFTDSMSEEEENPANVPQVEVAIVDGTNTGLATEIGESLTEVGWNIISTVSLSDLDPNLGPSPSTLIFISSEEYRPAANRLLGRFPGIPVELSSQFVDPITVLIGTDYAK
jgi:hypothetical protein